MKNENEIWKDIPGYEGCYQASTLGRIKTIAHPVAGKNPYTGNPFTRIVAERILRPGKFCKGGHVSVVLKRNTNGKPVHQLIMKTFIGDCPEGMEVLHKNGDPQDNRLINLRYGTRSENIIDVYYQGRRWGKLNIDEVQAIRFGFSCGISGVELSRMFGVSPGSISSIKTGKTFSWLK
jgi:hypothetical protein